MGSEGDADDTSSGGRWRARVGWAVASTALTVASVAAAQLRAWPVAVGFAVAVFAIQAHAAVRVWRTRRRLEDEVRHLRDAAYTGAALLVLTAVRNGTDTVATIPEEVGGGPDTAVLLDELVARGLLTALCVETAGRPHRRLALTASGLAVVSRTIHP